MQLAVYGIVFTLFCQLNLLFDFFLQKCLTCPNELWREEIREVGSRTEKKKESKFATQAQRCRDGRNIWK